MTAPASPSDTLASYPGLEADVLQSAIRERFRLPDGQIYLAGHSLGPLVAGVGERLAAAVDVEWRNQAVSAWNSAGWHVAPARVGARIAPLIGAGPGEVIVADSTTVNLFKLLVAARGLRPQRRCILVEQGDFPTDVYIAQSVAELTGVELRCVPGEQIADAIDDSVAVVAVTQVNYRSGRRHDMQALTARAHAHGALMLFDLSHSAGAMQIDLRGCDVDFAVGCGYKYLNGGPGAPAYVFVAASLMSRLNQPLTGWHGPSDSFAFADHYAPAPGIERMLCGTAPTLSLLAFETALSAFDGVDMSALAARGAALGDLFIDFYDAELVQRGFDLITPREAQARGAHIALAHEHAYTIKQALLERGIVGDFRAPDVIRFGLAPLHIRAADVSDTVAALADIVDRRLYAEPRLQQRAAVT